MLRLRVYVYRKLNSIARIRQMPTLPLSLVSQIFPPSILVAVGDYKKLAADYPNIADPTIKASYKMVLDKKLADLQEMLTAYCSTASAALSALAVQ